MRRDGREYWDRTGGVFEPIPGVDLTPCFSFGHGAITTPVFTCPVSAIADEVWELVDLFLTCRAMKVPPKAGGVLDQPLIVRRIFPVLEFEMAQFERKQDGPEAMAVAMLTALSGGGRRK